MPRLHALDRTSPPRRRLDPLSRGRRLHRIRFEVLESRTLLAQVNWVAPSSGDWDLGSNWSTGQVPGPSDDVAIEPSAGLTVTIDSGAQSANSLQTGSNANLILSGGSLTIASASITNSVITGSLSMTGGSLVASGAETQVTASGPVTAASGSLSAQSGAELSLPGLSSVSGSGMAFEADGTGSEVDLSAVAQFTGANNSISDTNEGTVVLKSSLKKLDGVSITVDGTGVLALDEITSLTDGGITVTGGSYTLPSITTIFNSDFTAESGASLTLPGVTAVSFATTLGVSAIGAGSTVDLPALTMINVQAPSFGASGQGSLVQLPVLTTFDNSGIGALGATGGGAVELSSSLTSLNFVNITVDATSTTLLAQFTSLTNCDIDVLGGAYTQSKLTDINGSNFYVDGGASLTLAAMTAVVGGDSEIGLNVSGTGSTLSLPAVTTTTGIYDLFLNVSGTSSTLNLPALATISCNKLSIDASGSGNAIDLSGVTALGPSDAGDLSVTAGSAVQFGSGTSLTNMNITTDGSNTMSLGQIGSLIDSTLDVEGGSYTLSNLVDIDGSSFEVDYGASLTMPSVTTDNDGATANNPYPYFWAATQGTTLSLPALTTISGYSVSIKAWDSGDVINLPTLATLNGGIVVVAVAGGQVLLPHLASASFRSNYGGFYAGGPGSKIDISSLTGSTDGSLEVTGGASLVDPNLIDLTDVGLTTDPTVTFGLSSNQTYAATTGSTLSISTGELVEQGVLTEADNATVNVDGSLDVDGQGALSFSPTATFEITGNVLGQTTNGDQFAPQGTMLLDGYGTATAPQLLEVMSQDLGNSAAGFQDNFAYGTLAIGNNNYVQLVDDAKNSPGTGPEALYVNALIVPAGSTLNLNGLHVYARVSQIAGTTTGGAVNALPSGGPIELNSSATGSIGQANQLDDWTFYGQTDQTVAVVVSTGSQSSITPLQPSSSASHARACAFIARQQW